MFIVTGRHISKSPGTLFISFGNEDLRRGLRRRVNCWLRRGMEVLGEEEVDAQGFWVKGLIVARVSQGLVQNKYAVSHSSKY
jgi:hypothetical protein